MISNRLDWTIKGRGSWTATHVSGTILVARTEAELMSAINAFDALHGAQV